MKGWLIGFAAIALLFEGVGQVSASFILNFDENGNGSISISGAALVPNPGTMLADPVEGGTSLTYRLPSLVPAVDVLIFEPGTTGQQTLSDMLRFTNANGVLDGSVSADRMIYYSDLEPNDVQGGPGTDLADRSFQPRTTSGILEVGPEGNNGFSLLFFDNTYNGISDTPEPATLTLLGIGLASMAGYGWRRRKAAAA